MQMLRSVERYYHREAVFVQVSHAFLVEQRAVGRDVQTRLRSSRRTQRLDALDSPAHLSPCKQWFTAEEANARASRTRR
jgi:hypothetical protein